MSINYYLQKNPITPDPDDCSARIASKDTLELDGVIDEMLKRGTTLDKVELSGTLDLYYRIIIDAITDGKRVNTPIASIKPGISGVFTNANDVFTQGRHKVKASLSQGVLLRDALANARVEKVTSSLPCPELKEFSDLGSQSTDSILTPGNIGTIVGEELKFNPDNNAEGIFLIDGDGNETAITSIATRTEGKLVFIIPAGLAAGSYKLQVRKAYTNSNTIRVGELNDDLSVS